MKKIIVFITVLFLLVSCQDPSKQNIQLYEDMTSLLNNATEFSSTSSNFNISINYSTTAEGKRYYIIVDSPKIAMYDVKVLAFEDGSDTSVEFAPNVGIFDEKINLVPNQINKENGFVKGISISGIFKSESPTILCLVQWENDSSKVFREFYKLTPNSLFSKPIEIKSLDNYYTYE